MTAFPHRIIDPRYTLGVVIPVPEPQRAQLHQWRVRHGSPDSHQVAPHITLVTGSHRGTWQQAAAHVAQVLRQVPAFDVHLGGACSFRPASQVVYLPLESGARQCHRIHASLLDGPLHHDSQFAYHPHLTITQNVPDRQLDEALAELGQVQMGFPVTTVQLFDMRRGQWNLTEQFDLA
ncbi:2'-5' RNA ligase family protein [Glutamicibacter sp. MNS18]|uniref:2'-5' RNA ligase family protein n=1 Tax=Glutamicibacter sp. MNS18 TaxID=2989817 RepID=UPI0022361960|nr:2'-5' RNA ligase family protein [Glutamicibacter sp. MNS18]MCW4465042.1 2'-5' RNA ligase family protein [Glutamicibacter sp. MNS18]